MPEDCKNNSNKVQFLVMKIATISNYSNKSDIFFFFALNSIQTNLLLFYFKFRKLARLFFDSLHTQSIMNSFLIFDW